ncbi:hypothetical protein ABH920_000001 [Catenulispora sp. EB89]|uniref:hypothetical protein n=1 Tax=Catenulispora sp. EB89 TaxID=3156257 RepID=UPI003511F617
MAPAVSWSLGVGVRIFLLRSIGERPIWSGKQVPIQFWSTAAEREFRSGPKARWKRKTQKRSAKIGNAEGERNQPEAKIARNCESAADLLRSKAKQGKKEQKKNSKT